MPGQLPLIGWTTCLSFSLGSERPSVRIPVYVRRSWYMELISDFPASLWPSLIFLLFPSPRPLLRTLDELWRFIGRPPPVTIGLLVLLQPFRDLSWTFPMSSFGSTLSAVP